MAVGSNQHVCTATGLHVFRWQADSTLSQPSSPAPMSSVSSGKWEDVLPFFFSGCPGAKKNEFLTSVLDALSTDMVHAVSDPSSPGRCAGSRDEALGPGPVGRLQGRGQPGQLSGPGRAWRRGSPPDTRSLAGSEGDATNLVRMPPHGTGPWDLPRFPQVVEVAAVGGEERGPGPESFPLCSCVLEPLPAF